MDSPFENYDILKLIVAQFKDDPYNLLKLAHTSSFFRNEIIKNDNYLPMIDIIKNNNIILLKLAEDKINNINNKKKKITIIIKNYLSNLKLLYNDKDVQKEINFIENQIKIKRNKLKLLNDDNINLNLKIERLIKKNNFFNQTFIECKILQRPLNRRNIYTPYTYIYVDKIKLKYIIQNNKGDYKYIENLYYNKNTNMLHLTSCGTLKNISTLNDNHLIFIKKDNLIDYTNLNYKYCKHCLNDIQSYLF